MTRNRGCRAAGCPTRSWHARAVRAAAGGTHTILPGTQAPLPGPEAALSGFRNAVSHGANAGDARSLSEMTHLPRQFWALLWIAGTLLAAVIGGKWLVLRS